MPPSNATTPISRVPGVRREYRINADNRRNRGDSRTERVAKRGTRATLKTTGGVVQGGGTVVKTGGSTAMRAGAAMSSTGVGAIVGVPLMVAGGAAYGAGTAAKAVGKVVSKSGDLISIDEGTKKPSKIGVFTVKFLKWMSITIIFAWQAVCFALFAAAFAIQAAAQGGSNTGFWDKIWGGDFKGAVQDVLQNVAAAAFGEDFAVSLAVGAWGISLAVTWFFLFSCLLVLLMQKWAHVSNIKPLNTSKKEMLFVVALVFYALPGAQVVPWGWFWLRHLQKHGADTE